MSLFDNIEYIEDIDEGSQAIVKKYRTINNIDVAIKIFSAYNEDDLNPEAPAELYACQVLKGCPNIIQILDIKIKTQTNRELQIMMPYYNSDLKMFLETTSFLKKIKYFPEVSSQLLTGLYYLHQANIIHRDIKPENVLINIISDNDELSPLIQLCIADFGLSLQLPFNKEHRNFQMLEEVYTIIYRPPELLNNNSTCIYDEKADIWSAGITLLEYLLGHQFICYQDNISNIQVMTQLLANLTIPYSLSDFRQRKIDAPLYVKQILKTNLGPYYFDMISESSIPLLTNMLQIHPGTRSSINDLISNVECCESNNIRPGRSRPLNMSIEMYVTTVNKLIIISHKFNFFPRTIISAIDILDRYFYNSDIIKVDDISIIIAACLLLSAKYNEYYAPEVSDLVFIFENKFDGEELKIMQILILKCLNYIIFSSDIDAYVYHYSKSPDIQDLIKTYLLIKDNNKYAGDLSYIEIISYLDQVRKLSM